MESKWKWISIGTVGTLFALSHIGMIGMLARRQTFPVVNLPVGEYTSYSVDASKEGYRINYRANDPLRLGVRKQVNKPAGFLGLGKSTTHFEEQYTMDGARHLDRSTPKTDAAEVACIKAQGGGESTGRIVGGGIGASVGTSLASVPYVGWVLAGAATMIGMDQGAEIGGTMAKDFADCD